MKAKAAEPGRVVVVLKGHDAGSWCAVLRVLDESTVLVCDGRLRTVAKPKKKRLKHLNPLPMTLPVTGRGESGGPIADSDIRKGLKAVRDAYETKSGGTAAVNAKKEECAFVQE